MFNPLYFVGYCIGLIQGVFIVICVKVHDGWEQGFEYIAGFRS